MHDKAALQTYLMVSIRAVWTHLKRKRHLEEEGLAFKEASARVGSH
jgi:hypothetical protein